MNRAQQILAAARRYNPSDDFLRDVYGLSSGERFDAIVVAPSWTPQKILKRCDAQIEHVSKHVYFNGYRADFAGLHLGWIQTASGAGNVIDAMLSLSDANTKNVIFMGAVGALVPEIDLGDLVTPSVSLAYEAASMYLSETLDASSFGREVVPHCGRFIDSVIENAALQGISVTQRRTFCTASIFCEYAHLPEIKASGAELIEMETAAFYGTLNLIGKRGMALLCVSDNSVSGIPLVARTPEQRRRFEEAREVHIPELIKIICR